MYISNTCRWPLWLVAVHESQGRLLTLPVLLALPGSAGATALRLVVLDSSYGCIQAATDLLASDLGAMNLDPSQPVQVGGLPACLPTACRLPACLPAACLPGAPLLMGWRYSVAANVLAAAAGLVSCSRAGVPDCCSG